MAEYPINVEVGETNPISVDVSDGIPINVEVMLPGTGGTGVSDFLALTDTPGSYSGDGNHLVKVDPGENGLIFGTTIEDASGNLTIPLTASYNLGTTASISWDSGWGAIEIDRNLKPDSDNNRSLGNTHNRFQTLFLGPGTFSGISMGQNTPTVNVGTITYSLTNSYFAFDRAISLGGNFISSVADPALPQDAATKNYVDNAITGENLWDRTGTLLHPHNAGDDVRCDGNMTIGTGALGVDYTLTFDGEDFDGTITWMEDEARFDFDETIRAEDYEVTGAGTNPVIDSNGFFRPQSSADGSAPNNSIYYSTTQSKLVYKDSGGTVNDLY